MDNIRRSFTAINKVNHEGVDSWFNFVRNGTLGLTETISPQILLAAFACDFSTGDIEAETTARLAKLNTPMGLETEDICLPMNPFDITNVIPMFGLQEVTFKKSNMLGAVLLNNSFNEDNTNVTFILKDKEHEYEKRFVLAHMMGHFFLNHFAQLTGSKSFMGTKPRFIENNSTIGFKTLTDKMEYEADIFALDLMIPQKVLQVIMDDGTYTVPEIIDVFEAPAEMIQKQAERMGRKLPFFKATNVNCDFEYFDIDI